VRVALDGLKKAKYPTLANQLQADIANYQTWTTYMYGSKTTRNVESPTQGWADKIRTQAVIRAESKLAKSAGIVSIVDESWFKVGKYKKHEATQASTFAPGQAMTVSVFATPLGGYHRIDNFDGSVAMSQMIAEYKWTEGSSIIDHVAKTSGKWGIEAQVVKLNTFLKSQGINTAINTAKYVEYLKNGDITKLWVPRLGIQEGKWTKVFEGRAMIAGNVCMNRIFGIGYPAFSLRPIDGGTPVLQGIEAVGSVDYTAQLNAQWLTVGESAIGLSPLGILSKINQNKSASWSQKSDAWGGNTTGWQNGPGTNGPGGPSTPPVSPPTPPSGPIVVPE
jgi:hypothetical protein